jgi:selenide, water dikinase
VIGIGHPKDIRRNSGAKPGDALILTKALGVGIYSAAFKKGGLLPQAYSEMIASMTLLDSVGMDLAKDDGVHAVTDVTGFRAARTRT